MSAAAVSSYYSSGSRGRTSSRFDNDRSSIYGKDRAPTYGSTSSFWRSRDASLGTPSANFGNRESYLYGCSGSAGTTPVVTRRARDASLQTTTRNPVMVVNGLGAETARYNREEALKEIRSNFLREFEDKRRKMPAEDAGEDYGRLSRARGRMIGGMSAAANKTPSALDEHMARKDCVSEMYMTRNKFSNRTVSAASNLNDCGVPKRKEDYQWRKELQEYEKSSEYERDKNRGRKRRDEEIEGSTKPPVSMTPLAKKERREESIYETRTLPIYTPIKREIPTSRSSVMRELSSFSENITPTRRDITRSSMIREPSYSSTNRASILREPTTSRSSVMRELNSVSESVMPMRASMLREPNARSSVMKELTFAENVTSEPRRSWRDSLDDQETRKPYSSRVPDILAEEPRKSWRDRLNDDKTMEGKRLSRYTTVEDETPRKSWRDLLITNQEEKSTTPFRTPEIVIEEPRRKSWKEIMDEREERDQQKKSSSRCGDSSEIAEEEPRKSSSWRDRINLDPEVKQEKRKSVIFAPEIVAEEPRKSWRDRLNEQEKEVSSNSNSYAAEEPRQSWRDRLSEREKTPSTKEDPPPQSWRNRLAEQNVEELKTSRALKEEELPKNSWRHQVIECKTEEKKQVSSVSKPNEPIVTSTYDDSSKSASFTRKTNCPDSSAYSKLDEKIPAASICDVGNTAASTAPRKTWRDRVNEKETEASDVKKATAVADISNDEAKTVKKVKRFTVKTSVAEKVKAAEEKPPPKKSVLILAPPAIPAAKAETLAQKKAEPVQKKKEAAKPKIEEEKKAADNLKIEEVKENGDENKENENKENQKKEEIEDDTFGTKQIRSDFDARMKLMEEEMMSGQGKLAKLRERIRKAKGVIKEADEAVANSRK